MIHIKNDLSIQTMAYAGNILSDIFDQMKDIIAPGVSTAFIDAWIEKQLMLHKLVSCTKGYHGYQHASCISVNDEVVHGVPRLTSIVKEGDLVKVDVCASWNGYCADMARCFFVGSAYSDLAGRLVAVAQQSLNAGIAKAVVGNRLSDISAAIQCEVERNGFSVVRDFAGHGIGKKMHEDPEILNYGKPGCGPLLKEGMAFAIEPMITAGKYDVYIDSDRWTVKTVDGSLAAHVEDTVVITNSGPRILTRKVSEQYNIKSFA